MRIAIPMHDGRISPVLDVAKRFVVVDMDRGSETGRSEARIDSTEMAARVRRIAGLGAQIVICGAVSWPLEAMLASAGVRLIPNTCGEVEEVVSAFAAGLLTDQAFLMPGCPGRRNRRRRRRGRR